MELQVIYFVMYTLQSKDIFSNCATVVIVLDYAENDRSEKGIRIETPRI